MTGTPGPGGLEDRPQGITYWIAHTFVPFIWMAVFSVFGYGVKAAAGYLQVQVYLGPCLSG